MEENEKKKRGNQGWSTAGRAGNIYGWSTKGKNGSRGAGRPRTQPTRKTKSIYVTDQEAALCRRVIVLMRTDFQKVAAAVDELEKMIRLQT